MGNIAEVEGGALYVHDYSSTAFNGDTVFSGTSAGDGGAVLAVLHFTIWFGGKTAFQDNLAVIVDEPGILRSGGGVAVVCSTLTFNEETFFADNQAQDSGGAVDAFGATVIITGKSSFLNNSGGMFGGLFLVLTLISSSTETPRFVAISPNTSALSMHVDVAMSSGVE